MAEAPAVVRVRTLEATYRVQTPHVVATRISCPTDLTFWAGAGTAVERMRFYASGGLYVGTTPSDPGANNLTVRGSLTSATLLLPSAASPAQTADGSMVWDSDDDVLTVGDGSSRKTFGYLGSTVGTTQAIGDAAAAGTGNEAARITHKHAMPSATDVLTAVKTVDGSGSGLDADLLDGLHGGIGARVYNSGAIALTTATNKALTFDTERFDTDTIHHPSSNTDRLTAVSAGKYLISATVRFESNATGFRQIQFELNGSADPPAGTMIAVQRAPAINGAITIISLATFYDLAANDWVRCIAYQDSGGNLNVEAAGNYSPEFMMMRFV